MWDFIIIGAGPTGLTLAWFLRNLGPEIKILVIERENSIGGCHRVKRVNGLFTEHGPRIYLDNYRTFIALLKDMGLDFNQFFTPYKFSQSDILKYIRNLSIGETLTLAGAFIRLLFNPEYGQNITVLQFLQKHQFSKESINYITRLCLLTDGGLIDRYPLKTFLEIINQNSLYNIYQPNFSNDRHLWSKVKQKITDSGDGNRGDGDRGDGDRGDGDKQVTFLLETEIYQILNQGNRVRGVMTNNGKIYYGKKVLGAIPPANLGLILAKSNLPIREAFGDFNRLKKWIEYTKYATYIPIIFYFPKIELPLEWGVPASDWGIASIVLSDYNRDLPGTVISTCISLPNAISSVTKLTANQTPDSQQLINETLRQLREIYRKDSTDRKDSPEPLHAIISPGINYDSIQKQYQTNDNAYFQTILGVLPPSTVDNFQSIGPHNGKSDYSFTSLESAVENAYMYLRENYHITVKHLKPDRLWTIRDFLLISLVIFIIGVMVIVILIKPLIGNEIDLFSSINLSKNSIVIFLCIVTITLAFILGK